ncbi:MAG: OmpA family protein [Paracoccus sp. (in: a-proteobacteria)]|uniref:OmpA family protein n=1 Tax=Paracoccus sp. TaxID=267 RepID=UPI0026DEC05B|nr:OmpA family protein [Paracoccus sp. (in: a-proteobacteria)]MDO5632094.1 OmpA family protein [Paracoccus sp. (in: a-proteobacteria)]
MTPRFPLIAAAAALPLLALMACTQPAPPQLVADPYVNTGSGAVYQGNITQGALGGQATAAYFSGTVGDTVSFVQDEVSLSAEARAILTRQAEWLRQHTNFTARIEGHADEMGTREYNLALGARRAGAVQEYLIAQGIDTARVQTSSFGKERPIEVCSTEVCFARNRRAVTVVTPSDAPVAPPVAGAGV